MTDTDEADARPGNVEFCTLGMFILGTFHLHTGDPAKGMLILFSAQITLISAALDQVSRTSWVAQHLSQSWERA